MEIVTTFLLFLTRRLLGLSLSLVTLPDGVNNEGSPVASNKSGANATNTTANPYGDFGTASCRGQVSSTLSKGDGALWSVGLWPLPCLPRGIEL